MKTYHEIPGDRGSDILGQNAALREKLEARLSRVQHVVAVMSGKDGVGKSTLTANLAALLADESHAVGVVDADLNGPALARMLGVRRQSLRLTPEGMTPAVGAAGVRVISMDVFLRPRPSARHSRNHSCRDGCGPPGAGNGVTGQLTSTLPGVIMFRRIPLPVFERGEEVT